MRSFHLHLISDSSGETVSAIARACLVQLSDVQAKQHLWWLIRTRGQAIRALEGVRASPGVVLCTVVDPEIRALLEQGCREAEVPFIPVLDPRDAGIGQLPAGGNGARTRPAART